MEPLLLRLGEVSSGIVLNARLENKLSAPLVPGIKENDESFVDDVEIFCSADSDFFMIDLCVEKFERVSGAILNRTNKSVVMGLGLWKDRTIWPLKWLKTVTEVKVFGFVLTPLYSEIVEKNWTAQFNKFNGCLISWYNRALNSIQQRVDVLSIFALSKVWYRATVLPLPDKFATKFETATSQFLWKGHITNNVIARDTMSLPKDRGGMGLPQIRLK